MTKDNEIKRRSFLKIGMTGLAGIGLASQTYSSAASEEVSVNSKITTRVLGKTGIEVPVVSMGVMNADNPALVAAALDSGIKFLDTAWGYQRGRNEEMIGKVIKGKPRDSYYIATKVPGSPRDRRTGNLTAETDPQVFHEWFDQSLNRLGLEYVDILHLHNVKRKEDTMFEPLMKAMEKEKNQGRAKFLGISTHSNEPEVINAMVDTDFYDVVLTGYNFQKDYIAELDESIARAAGAGMGIIAMKTQAGVYWDKEKTDMINMKAALKWALKNTNIHTAIPGFTTFDQMKLDVSVMENLELTEEEIRDLRLDQGMAGLYCQQCEKCLPACPRNLPVPDIMRSYMYAYGYRNIQAAYDLLKELNLPENPCSGCLSCGVQCAKGFSVKNRIKDITRLQSLPAELLS